MLVCEWKHHWQYSCCKSQEDMLADMRELLCVCVRVCVFFGLSRVCIIFETCHCAKCIQSSLTVLLSLYLGSYLQKTRILITLHRLFCKLGIRKCMCVRVVQSFSMAPFTAIKPGFVTPIPAPWALSSSVNLYIYLSLSLYICERCSFWWVLLIILGG